jgi:DNA invertase Pin-like site-specific DNA recombinase
MKEKKICAAYVRVSTDDQLDYSPESQINLIKEYAKKNNMFLPPEYIFRDDGISGRTAKKRPGFLQMIATAKQKPRPFDVILVWKFSRFARNQEESVVYKSLLKKENDIDVVSISEPLIEGPFGGLIERIIEWFDAFYSVNLATEVRRGMTERVKQGGAVSVAPIGYTYKDKQLVIDPESAEVVKMIFDSFLAGESIIGIAHKLNSMGIKTRRGNIWENRTVRYVLTNPVYTGKVRWSAEGTNNYHVGHDWNENTMLVDGTHKALISSEIFEHVQDKLRVHERRYRSTSNKVAQREKTGMLLQGLVKCSSCGSTLTRTGTGMNCVSYVHGKCKVSHYVSLRKIEELVLTSIEAQLNGVEMTVIRRELPRQADQTEILLQQLRKEETVLAKCKEAYLAGIDTIDEYKENKAAAQQRIEKIQQLLAEQENTAPVNVEDFAEKHRPIIDQLKDPNIPISEKNLLLRSFVDHIVFDNKDKTITITYYE